MPHFLEQEIAADKGRATQGIPTLDSPRRVLTGYREKQRAKSRAMAEEALAQERNAFAADAGRPKTEGAAQIGTPMQAREFQRRLRKVTTNLHFEHSLAYPDRICIYRILPFGEKKYLCAMMAGVMPEFSVLHEDSPYIVVKGWRGVLVQLMHHGVLGKEAAIKTFGVPTWDSEFWQQET